MRENKRYLVFRGKREDVERAILDFIGILGYSQSGVSFPKADILAVNREMLDKIRASLALADIKVLRVSGTIKKVKNE